MARAHGAHRVIPRVRGTSGHRRRGISIRAREPEGIHGELRWHLSISCLDRHPSWDELKTARYRLLPHDVAFALTDRITVLHFGKVLTEGAGDAVRANPLVQEIYLGTS